jgi:hypothetical protein
MPRLFWFCPQGQVAVTLCYGVFSKATSLEGRPEQLAPFIAVQSKERIPLDIKENV